MKKFLRKLKEFFRQLRGKEERREEPAVAAPAPATAPAPSVSIPAVPTQSALPAVVVIHGVRVQTGIPINKDWIPPSGAMTMFGQYFGDNGPVLTEDRIARPLGARSPMGFPMWDGKVRFAEGSFDNDDAVMRYVNDVATRDANLAKWKFAFDAVRYRNGYELAAAALSDREVGEVRAAQDAWFAFRVSLVHHHRDLPGHVYFCLLDGSHDEINRVINSGWDSASPEVHDGVKNPRADGRIMRALDDLKRRVDAGEGWKDISKTV